MQIAAVHTTLGLHESSIWQYRNLTIRFNDLVWRSPSCESVHYGSITVAVQCIGVQCSAVLRSVALHGTGQDRTGTHAQTRAVMGIACKEDMLIVIFGLVQLLLGFIGVSLDKVTILRMLRVVRIMRLFRLFRKFAMLKELRKLIRMTVTCSEAHPQSQESSQFI